MNSAPRPSEPMSGVDYAWLRMDEPSNLMTINSVFLFDEAVDFDRLKAVVSARLGRYDRFRQRVVEPDNVLDRPRWEADPHYDVDAHFQRVTLHGAGDRASLQALIGELMSQPLDRSRPLWQVTLAENYGKGSAVIIRLHHCIADGIALMKVLLSMTDEGPDAPLELEPPATSKREPRTLLDSARGVATMAQRFGQRVVDETRRVLDKPVHAWKLGMTAVSPATALGRLVLLPPDPKTPFKGPLGLEKRAVWTRAIPLADVKAASRAVGGTINDVLVTAITGALRSYLVRHGAMGDYEIRAVAPVNLRPPAEADGLGNRFGLAFLTLPIRFADPIERLHELKRRMDVIKKTPEAVVVLAVLYALGFAAKEIESVLLTFFGAKGTLVLTNVPGPQKMRYLAGKPLRDIVYWVPQSGRLGMGVSIFSYHGELRIGIATDAGLVPNPNELVDDLHNEIDALLATVTAAPEAKQNAAS